MQPSASKISCGKGRVTTTFHIPAGPGFNLDSATFLFRNTLAASLSGPSASDVISLSGGPGFYGNEPGDIEIRLFDQQSAIFNKGGINSD